MGTPGNGDYRLRDLERRLQNLEQQGSPASQRLMDRLEAEKEARIRAMEVEREARKDGDKVNRDEISRIDKAQARVVGVFITVVGGVAIAVISYFLTRGR